MAQQPKENVKVPFKFKKVRSVTLPLFKWKNDEERYYKLSGQIFISRSNAGDKDKEPPHLVNVIDLTTGEEGQIILGSVLVQTLNEDYPEQSYIGKSFAITQKRDTSKKYNTYTVIEIDPEEAS